MGAKIIASSVIDTQIYVNERTSGSSLSFDASLGIFGVTAGGGVNGENDSKNTRETSSTITKVEVVNIGTNRPPEGESI